MLLAPLLDRSRQAVAQPSLANGASLGQQVLGKRGNACPKRRALSGFIPQKAHVRKDVSSAINAIPADAERGYVRFKHSLDLP